MSQSMREALVAFVMLAAGCHLLLRFAVARFNASPAGRLHAYTGHILPLPGRGWMLVGALARLGGWLGAGGAVVVLALWASGHWA